MRIFFDTEFTGLHQNTTLVSIGLVSEAHHEFYAEFTDYDKSQIDNWLQENVIGNLYLHKEHEGPIPENGLICENGFLGNTKYIKSCLSSWLSEFDKVQMVSDCLSYDWVLFCQLWGHAFNIPSNVSPTPRDINQDIADYLGIDEKSAFDIDREVFANTLETSDMVKHNAFWDAKVIKACYRRLTT